MQQEQSIGTTSPQGQAPIQNQPVEQQAVQQPAVRHSYSDDQQNHVNSLISAKYHEGIEKGYQRALKEQKEREAQAPIQPIPHYAPQPNHQAPPYTPIDPGMIKQMVEPSITPLIQAEVQKIIEAERQKFEAKKVQDEINYLSQNLEPKINAARQKYPDFEQKVKFGALRGGEWFRALGNVDNAGDVLYSVMDNPQHLVTIGQLLNSGNPDEIEIGKAKLHSLSQSLKNNEASASKKIPNEPISEVRPSKVNSSGDVNLTKWARETFRNHV